MAVTTKLEIYCHRYQVLMEYQVMKSIKDLKSNLILNN